MTPFLLEFIQSLILIFEMTAISVDGFTAGIFLTFGFYIRRPFSPIPAARVKLGSVVGLDATYYTTDWLSLDIVLEPCDEAVVLGKVKLTGGFATTFSVEGKGEVEVPHAPITVSAHANHKTDRSANSTASYVQCQMHYADPALNARDTVKNRLKALITNNPNSFKAGGTYGIVCSLITATDADLDLTQHHSAELEAGAAVTVPLVASGNVDGSNTRTVQGEAKVEGMKNVLVGYHLWGFTVNSRWKFWTEKTILDRLVMGDEKSSELDEAQAENLIELDKIQLDEIPRI